MERLTIKALAIGLVWTMAGCIEMNSGKGDQELGASQPSAREADYLGPAAVQGDAETEGQTAVENALIWSEKYSEAVEKLAEAQKEKHEVENTNRQLSEEVVRLQQQIKQYEKELADSNAMLMEMKDELARWKADVLGFRNEMRQAQETQLVALQRVLKLLGGDLGEAEESLAAGAGARGGDLQ